MEINNLLRMDGNIVFSIINERLRLECDSVSELVSRYELDEAELIEKMDEYGFQYDPLSNQFR
ncbi:DUF4250 domain-containing protein [Photobacterium frigidiphilum]|uniref:DUF4250 domain-containing protein n=1 Tax=Photobacterium frigidiphilum TaxID=264736 RepID=A0A2T3JCK0_9GAMM|nr:DUF4250 domain-containing protein [Photobacterium frigidiphilum]PSU46600.1 DUF4250 domain-containing protein [Photobacterium frigidiphilum]